MNYKECLRYLEKIQNLGIKFGLDNVRTILSSLDNPHRKYPSLLVAGTNGKGSVCAMLSHILTLHHLRVGLFTSPHLIKVEERIRIGERPISSQDFCRELTLLRETIEDLITSKKLSSSPTYFELLTCLAFNLFKKKKVNVAILEVGMGGRFDATNVVIPIVSIITTISKEHQKFLGDTLVEIASEKAGIIKPGIPVVCGVTKREAFKTIKEKASELEAPFYGVFDKKDCFNPKKTQSGYSFIYESNSEKYLYSPSLPGKHQGENAAVVIVASERLSKNWKRLEKENIIKGIEGTRWEGRLEILPSNPRVILDGAHNEEGARALKSYIQEFITAPLILVAAFMRDKKIETIANILFPLAERIILTRFPYYRAATPEEICDKALEFKDKIILEPNTKKALEMALFQANPQGCILFTGSLYLVGEVKKYLPY
ncbi:MAG: folylpolyglutamate synthase/dihydrofolate synthase family protein [Candidatus Aminicenantaceae bacterium]